MDIEQVRNETRNCQDKIFLNSAGSSLMPDVVTSAVQNYIEEEARIGGYKLKENREAEIEDFYAEGANLLNCHPRNIAFANNATEAFSKALSCIPFEKGDVILTSDDDYVSNYFNFISLQKRYGIQLKRIRNLDSGDLDLEHFKQLVESHRPKLVSITHMPTNSGLIQNVSEIGKICKQKDIIYIVDACQSVGQIQVDIRSLNCDFLSVTGRKFLRGPRGTGLLFVSDKMLAPKYTPLYVDLGGANWVAPDEYKVLESARRFETWEQPYALIIGLKEAIKYANQIGMKNIEKRNLELSANLRSKLKNVPGVTCYDKGENLGSICTFRKKEISRDLIQEHLDAKQIFYSIVGSDSALIDLNKKGIDWLVRFSPHYFNTENEIDQAVEVVGQI